MGWVGRCAQAGTLALAVGACATGLPAPPEPVRPPRLADLSVVLPSALEDYALPEPGPLQSDEILESPLVRRPEVRAEVVRWVEYWETTGARWFPEYLERMQRFSPIVDDALARRGLPASLRYLPLIESGYSPRAVSRAQAVGLWQFIAPTARLFGMWVGPLLDERRNPFKSTEAAGDFLLQLREQFGSWFLALAAYNSGPYRVQRLLDTHAPLVPRSDSLYWALRERLPRETRDFVPKLLAAAIVAANPQAHGFASPAESAGFLFEEVEVPDATTLDVVARAAGVPQAEIERLNPEVVRGITPPGRRTTLRVPAGSASRFVAVYPQIPPGDRVTFVEHRVARGETLSHIAIRYHVSLTDLRAANPGVNPRSLQIGQRLTVPIAPRARPAG